MPVLRRLRAVALPIFAAAGLVTCGGDEVTLPSDALPASIDAMGGDAQTGVVGRALDDSLVVRLTDSRDRPVLGQPVEFRSLAGGDSALLQPDTAITDADGRARSRWILGQSAGVQTVEARVLSRTSRSLAVTFTATAAPAGADTIIAVSGQDQVAKGGETLPDSLVVAVTDQFGNPLEGVTVNWSVPAGQGSVSAPSGVTGANGRTAVSRTLGIISGPQSATARVPSAADVSVVFRHTALAGGAVRLVRISPDNQVAPVGSRLADSMVVMAQDIAGNGVPGETITWVADGDGSAAPTSSVTNFEGKAWTFWTLPTTSGATTLTAAGFGNVTRFRATATAASADTLLALSPTTFDATAGQGVPSGQRPSVRVSDSIGNPVQGVAVTFAVTQGGGTIADGTGSGTTVTLATDANGTATLSAWTLGVASGSNVVRASASRPGGGALHGSPVTFTATGQVGSATQLVFGVEPAGTKAGSSITPAVTVLVQDRNGNTVTSSSQQVTIALGANPGGGSLSGTLTVNAVSGVASFGNLSINRTGAGYTLVATASGLTTATSSDFNINPGTATRLGFLTQPSSAGAGATISPPVRVAVQDQFGNTVTTSSAGVSLTIGTNPASGTLSGGGSVNAVNGVATFDQLSINAAGSGYTLIARSGSLASATSSAFGIGSGAGTRLAFVVQPSTVAAGAAISPSVQVAIQDANGNTSSSSDSVELTLASNPGSATLSGGRARAVNGIATFPGLTLDKAGTGYTLKATSGSLTAATSGAFNVTAGSGQKLVFGVQPTSVGAGQPISPAVKVEMRDANDNLVTSFTGQVTLALGTNPANGTLGGTRTVSATAGVATFGNLVIDSTGAGYTLRATAGTATAATSQAFDVTAGTPSRLAWGVQPGNVSAGASIAPAVTVRVLDANGNVVTTSTKSITIALGANPGSGTLSGTRTVTAVAGVATFDNLSIDRTGTGYTLVADDGAGALAAITSATFNVQAGTGNKLVFIAQPSNTPAGAAISPAIRVAVQDASGNTLTSATDSIRLSLNPAGGNLGGTVGVRAVNGVATFSDITVGIAAGNYTITAFAPLSPLISATSAAFDVTKAASTTTITADTPDPSIVGQPYAVAFQVSGTGGTPTGTVTVTAGSDSCQGTLTGGAGSCQLTGTAAGDLSLNASYAGDATFNASTSASAAHAVSPAATTLTVTGDTPDPSNPGENVTVSFALAITAPGAGTPTGTVTVTDSVDSCSAPVASGSCVLALTTSGPRTLVASYSGDANFAGDTATTAHTVNPAPPTSVSLVFTQQPSNVKAGDRIRPPIKIELRDQNDSLIASDTTQVTVILGNNFLGLATLGGTTTRTTKDGVATFDNLEVNGITLGADFTLVASTPAATDSTTSATFRVSP